MRLMVSRKSGGTKQDEEKANGRAAPSPQVIAIRRIYLQYNEHDNEKKWCGLQKCFAQA